MQDKVAPFPRGQTGYKGGTPDSSLATTDAFAGLEGLTKTFQDIDSSTNPPTIRSSREVTATLVRNVSGIALLPGRICTFKSTKYGMQVDGYCRLDYTFCAGVVDDQLPSAGVPNNDVFWLIRRGPCLVRQALSQTVADIAQGNVLVALTGATSQCTTAGRFDVWGGTATSTGTTTGDAQNICLNLIGRAISASNSTNTNGNVLVDLKLL